MFMNSIAKLEDGYIKMLEQSNREIEKLSYKEQSLQQIQAEKDQKIKGLEEEIKNSNETLEQINRQCMTYIR